MGKSYETPLGGVKLGLLPSMAPGGRQKPKDQGALSKLKNHLTKPKN